MQWEVGIAQPLLPPNFQLDHGVMLEMYVSIKFGIFIKSAIFNYLAITLLSDVINSTKLKLVRIKIMQPCSTLHNLIPHMTLQYYL